MRRSVKGELLAGVVVDLVKFVVARGCVVVIFVLFVHSCFR